MSGHSFFDISLCVACLALPPCWQGSSSCLVHTHLPGCLLGSAISNTTHILMTHQLLPDSRPGNPKAHLELPPAYLQSIAKSTRPKPSPQSSRPAPLHGPISGDDRPPSSAWARNLEPLCLLSFTSSTACLPSKVCWLRPQHLWTQTMRITSVTTNWPKSPLRSTVTVFAGHLTAFPAHL